MRFLLAVLSVAGALAAGISHAEAFLKFGEVDGWKVYIDDTKKSCLIERMDEAGTVVQMGLTEDRGVGYLGVFTTAETGIKAGDKDNVIVLIGENLYKGIGTGMRGNITGGYSGGYITSDDPRFVEDIANQREMIVFPESRYAFVVDLTGTKKALELARKCNAEIMG